MKAKGVEVYLSGNEPGFTLPSNIGELGDDITQLNLYRCSLTGQLSIRSERPSRVYHIRTLFFARPSSEAAAGVARGTRPQRRRE